jgi:hypothetical protein
MAGYFKNFPGIAYTFSDNNAENVQIVTNILARSNFLKEISENTAIYYTYQIKDTDTPEIIADKLYNDPQRHWIVLLFNKIHDPFYQFPMRQSVLDKYIPKKYNQSLSQSQSTIHHYEMRINKVTTLNSSIVERSVDYYTVNENQVNFQTGQIIPRASLPGTADSEVQQSVETIALPGNLVCNITTTIRAVSNYTYEVEQNEKRRTIKLLDKQYIPQVEQEFRLLMQNG